MPRPPALVIVVCHRRLYCPRRLSPPRQSTPNDDNDFFCCDGWLAGWLPCPPTTSFLSSRSNSLESISSLAGSWSSSGLRSPKLKSRSASYISSLAAARASAVQNNTPSSPLLGGRAGSIGGGLSGGGGHGGGGGGSGGSDGGGVYGSGGAGGGTFLDDIDDGLDRLAMPRRRRPVTKHRAEQLVTESFIPLLDYSQVKLLRVISREEGSTIWIGVDHKQQQVAVKVGLDD
jgi:hypothetical protein